MLPSVLVAVTLGLVALAGLTGRSTAPSAWTATVMAGLPVVALSGAALAEGGWNLPWALGMVAAVVVGMLASMIGPARVSPTVPPWLASAWWVLTGALLAAVLAGSVARWTSVLAGSLANLSPRAIALVVVVAATAAAVGGMARRTAARTAVVVFLVLAGLLVVAGVVTGVPALLGDPLIPVTHTPASGVWLVVVVLLGALNPGLREVRAEGGSVVPGTIVLGAVMLLALVALLMYSGGSLVLPAFSLTLIAGYVAFAPPAAGSVLAAAIVLVAAVAAAVTLHGGLSWLRPLAGTDAVPASWWASRWFAGIAVGVAAAGVAIAELPVESFAGIAALLAAAGAYVGGRAGSADGPEPEASAEPGPVGDTEPAAGPGPA